MDLTATEDILHNSAALHSLKRDQLIRLCKIHGVKASGKNVDIAERLASIPRQATQQAPQPQLVTINEDTVTSTGTTKTGSDFGSVKSSLSLKSIVSSFGFTSRKTTSTPPTSISTTATSLPSTMSSQDSHAVSVPLPSSPPPPLITPFTPPPNVDTVRLVAAPRPSAGGTPSLPAFKTTFDLVLGTPANFGDSSAKIARYAMAAERDGEEKKEDLDNLKTTEVEKGLVENLKKVDKEESAAGRNEEILAPQTPSRVKLPTPSPAFTFGSPAPHVFRPRLSSNVKASVFEEMMRRATGESESAGDNTFVVVDGPATPTDPNRPIRPLPRKSVCVSGPPPPPPVKSPVSTVSSRFDKAHEAAFKKMTGINEARGPMKRKIETEPSIDDRRVSTKLAPKACAGRPSVIGANGVRRTSGIHGGRRSSVRPRTSAVGGRRISIRPPPPPPSRKGFNFGFSGLKGLFFGKKKDELEPDAKPAAPPNSIALQKKGLEKGKKPGLTGLGLGKVAPTTATTQSTATAAPSRKVSAPTNSHSSLVPNSRKVSAPTTSISSTRAMGPPTTTSRKVSTSSTSKVGPSSGLRPPTATASSVTTRGSLSSTTRGSISSTTARAPVAARNSSLSSTARTSAARTSSINSTTRTSSIPSSTRLSSVAANTRSSTARGSLSSTTALAPASARNSSLTSAARGSIGRPSVTSTRPLRPSAVGVSRQTKPTLARREKENVPLRGVPERAEPDLQDEEQGMAPKKIFSQPLTVPSQSSKGTLNRSLSGRRPRISRTTVVARLAARRAGPTTALSTAGSRRSLVGGDGGGRVRSSFGASGKANVLGVNGAPRKSMPGKRGSMQLGKGGVRKSIPGKRPGVVMPV
ncbi:hypothetical protein IW261DRAFT_1560277 [Armillaria novae-zelandiae]|uniref:SAP domain-containing protein n=1 Tax=Armillaria novae-zelandiae TaxID=153914 RepID=A0AA39TEV0_9AGAR|nr:hypothetical protein IW261DRAFT_1560277 [Armillaria novae-zelandiae]